MSQYIVMGVSGSGKSTVAKMLADKTDGLYFDADDFHPAANKAKMAAGVPLTDEDRWPWLDIVSRVMREHAGRTVFMACSALRQVYRDRLAAGLPGLRFIYLKGSRELIRERMESRSGHFMPAALLDSQFATLEEPAEAIVVGISHSPEEEVEEILARIGER